MMGVLGDYMKTYIWRGGDYNFGRGWCKFGGGDFSVGENY